MKLKIFILFTIILSFLTSCDYFIQNEGYVKDSNTNKGLEGVRVQMVFGKNKNDTIDLIPVNGLRPKYQPLLTDSTGYFKFGKNTGRKPRFYLRFSKNGYNEYIINGDSINNHTTLEILMIKEAV